MDDLLVRLLDDARTVERRAARGRERLLQQVEEDGASLSGTLVDLAERASAVTVRTASGRSHHGVVRLVGADFCVVAADGGDVWVSFSGVVTVRPHVGERHGVASGSRATLDLRLVEAMARVAPDRPRVAMVTQGGHLVSGELRSVGVDVVTLQLDGDPHALCYVSADSIREVLRSG